MTLNTETKEHRINTEKSVQNVCKKIAPSWSLKNMVAVNPYMGFADHSFREAASHYKNMAGIDLVMPIDFYINQLESGSITNADLKSALKNTKYSKSTVSDFKLHLTNLKLQNVKTERTLITAIDLVSELTGKKWNEFVLGRISNWAASFFDQGQAFWKTANHDKDVFKAWKIDAQLDRSPKIMGLKNFHSTLAKVPNDYEQALDYCLTTLSLTEDVLETYLHSLLLKYAGWTSYMAGFDWDNNLYGGEQTKLKEFLCILLTWEVCILETVSKIPIKNAWLENLKKITDFKILNKIKSDLEVQLILQDALDYSRERQLVLQFENQSETKQTDKRPKAQAVFCIDVRSEVYRRNLEQVDSNITTYGFAGFFGVPVKYKEIGQTTEQNKCPALIPSSAFVKASLPNENDLEKAKAKRINTYQVEKTWKQFKTGAISGFSFVSPLGLFYFFKLLTDSFGWTRTNTTSEKLGIDKKTYSKQTVDISGIAFDDQVGMAKSALAGMSLTNNFARLVLITGHGSETVNNPHATGLDCGACGGHSGEVNAKTAVAILNDQRIRQTLIMTGIKIPDDTHFLACLHNTTTDEITILNEELVPKSLINDLTEIKNDLTLASIYARQERIKRFETSEAKDIDKAIKNRSKDWSTLRPEWGLAGCSAFIIAPRHRTQHINLDGKSFLHSYNPKDDKEGNILEAIICAPMIVTSWINLQYYASTVDNNKFGAGNKTLHNVTGGFGVIEGGSGDLRVGLPMQSVHDGTNYQNTPNRLNVIIEAPIETINKIIEKHKNVKDLVENGWIKMLQLDETGKIAKRYKSDLTWETINEKQIELNSLDKVVLETDKKTKNKINNLIKELS